MLGRLQFWTVVVLLAAVFPAQAHAGPAAPAQTQAAVDPVKPSAQDPNYIIGAQDVLDISVWKEAELTRTIPVRPAAAFSWNAVPVHS